MHSYLLIAFIDKLVENTQLLTQLHRMIETASGGDSQPCSTGKNSIVVAFIPQSPQHLTNLQEALASRTHPIGAPYLLVQWDRSMKGNLACLSWLIQKANQPFS